MKTAKEFWKEKFGEYPQNDSEKLAVAMMAEYGNYITPPPKANPFSSFREKTYIEVYCKTCDKRLDDEDYMAELFRDKADAIAYLEDYGWKVIGSNAFCEKCS